MRLFRVLPAFLVAAIAPAIALGQTLPAACGAVSTNSGFGSTVNTFASNIQSALGGTITNSEVVGKEIFTLLFAAEIVWFLIETAWRRRNIADLVSATGFRLLSIMTFSTLLWNVAGSGMVTSLINDFTNTGNYIGQGVNVASLGGTSTASITTGNGAGTMINTGMSMANCIITIPFHAFENQSFLGKVGTIGKGVVGGLAALTPGIGDIVMAATLIILAIEAGLWLLILFTFLIIVAQYLITLAEGTLILSAGVFLLGFSAARWTMPFAQAYWRFAISIAMKLFACTLVATIGAGLLTNVLNSTLQEEQTGAINSILIPIPTLPISGMCEIFLVAAFVLLLAFKIPHIASTLITGNPSFTFAETAETAIAAGGIAAAPLMAAAGGIAAAAAPAAAAAGNGAAGALSAGAKGGGKAGSLTSGAGAVAPPASSSGSRSAGATPEPPGKSTGPKSSGQSPIAPLVNAAKGALSHSALKHAGTAGHDLGMQHGDL